MLLQSAGLSIPRTWMFDSRAGWANSRKPDVGLRVIAKPNFESASVGVDKDSVFEFGDNETVRLSKLTQNLQQPILVQEFISGWEVEVPVLSGKDLVALDPVGISFGPNLQMGDRFVDHSAAYAGTYQLFDFGESEPVKSEHLRKSAARAVQALGIAGVARIDFRVSPSGEAYIIDMTGKPHLSRHSSVAVRFEMLGLRYRDIFSTMVGLASSRS
jgi:D-alanine-D-alanine ligase